jgi:predicted molibdopterin-dependent oxidoreductase YjgC
VANPKRIELCRFADIYLQQRPGTDVPLLMGMMRVIVEEGLQDNDFISQRTENYEAFRDSLAAFDLDTVSQLTGVPKEKIKAAARAYATQGPSSILYAMGITQHTHGTDNVLAISNLALLTGNVGRHGSGVNPLRGQNNVQGACDMGALPNVYPGYQRVDFIDIQNKFEKAWGAKLSNKIGLTHTEILDQAHEERIKALYLVGENPVLSEANAGHARKSMEHLDFFVAQDIFLTESAKLADVVLPAVTFAEKDGTFTNTERRVQRVRKAIEPVGDAKPDWLIVCEIARRMGASGFDFSSPESIMEEIRSVTPSYGGIAYDRIESVGLQWPCPLEDHPGTPFLHQEQFPRAGGKGLFMPLEYRASMELPDKDYPLLLTTDRSLYHYHTSTMTRKVEGLNVLDGEEYFRINPQDADRYGVSDGQMIEVASRRGKVKVRAKVTDVCPPGIVSMTFHFAESPTNVLTNNAIDPVAKIPETKVCAVRVVN